MSDKICIGITGLQATDNPDPGLAIARALKISDKNVHIIGLSYGLYCTGNFSPYFDEIFLIPYPWDSEHQWLSRIKEIHMKTKMNVIIPSLDTEIVLFAKLSHMLNTLGIKVMIPPEEAVKTRAKNFLPEWCKQNNIKTPDTKILTDHSQIAGLEGQIGYPCLLKGSIAGAYVARNNHEANIYYDHLLYYWGLPVIAQQLIKGDDFDIAALADERSQLMGSIAIKKLSRTSLGKCSIGTIIENQDLLHMTQKIINLLHWQGPLEIEWVHNSFTHEYYLIEINARFPAWIYISAAAQYNLPAYLIDLALGKVMLPLSPCKSGLSFIKSKQNYFLEGSSYGQLAGKGELSKEEIYSEML